MIRWGMEQAEKVVVRVEAIIQYTFAADDELTCPGTEDSVGWTELGAEHRVYVIDSWEVVLVLVDTLCEVDVWSI